MKKFKKSVGLALLVTATSALASCNLFKKGGNSDSNAVQFWSSFGAAYTGALDEIVGKVSKATGVTIEHESKGGYPEIRREMISAVAAGDYPNIATGYPDHFVSYLSKNVLVPLDDLFTAEEKADFYEDYLEENIFYDNAGANSKKRLYGVPFNKSTELLGYNGVFVDYCASLAGNEDLATIPATWQEWGEDGGKGEKYQAIFRDLAVNKKTIYGKQDASGHASDFAETAGGDRELLLDFSQVDANQTLLMAWDSPENAFITLIKQWGARYTELPEDQAKLAANRRVGSVWFTEANEVKKVVECLKFFNKLYKKGIFGVPGHLGGSYATDAMANCRCMFSVCSSGGLSYNTTNWKHRFTVAPIPYYDDGTTVRKAVISQGANLCLTKRDGQEDAFKVLKALSSSEYQAEWCLQTGYFPSTKSVTNSAAYQAFLNSTSYENSTAVAYREGAKVNANIYTKASEGWNKFVDPAFEGSAILREKLTGVIKAACDLSSDASDDAFKNIIMQLKDVSDLKIPQISFK